MSKNYWDLTEQQRAALTRDDVAKYVDFELMQEGVLKPAPLELVPVPVVELAKATYYVVESTDHRAGDVNKVAFRTEEDARAFLALRPVEVAYDWQIGAETKFGKALTATQIVAIELARHESVEVARATLKEVAAANAENDRRRREHEEQSSKVERALKGLWDDWHECVAQSLAMQRIARTFAEYRETAGDHDVAAKFLRKAFSATQIAKAQEWTGVDMSEAPVVEQAEAC